MEQDTIDLLKDLVAIDSQNPSLVPGAAGESEIAAYVADWAKGAGLAAEIVEGTPGRPSVLVRRRSCGTSAPTPRSSPSRPSSPWRPRTGATRETEISVAGVAAHGSRPHLGVDAIMKTGPVLTALDDLNERLRGREHPRLGRGFVHASLIGGGREESTIPDSCTLTIERRTLPGETTEDTERDIAGLLDRCRAADPALRVRGVGQPAGHGGLRAGAPGRRR